MRRISLFVLMALPCVVFGGDLPTLTKVEGTMPKGVDPALVKLLSKTSYSIVEDGKEMLHLWIREEIPSNGEAGDFVGSETIDEGVFVGVYEVKEDSFTDFRGQELAPGMYTLRMSIHPLDGNHMGIAPTQQFLCLVLAAEDKSAEPTERELLMEQSKRAAGTGHPAALYAEPVFEEPKEAQIRETDSDNVVLDLVTQGKLESGEKANLPLAIVFIGETAGG